MSLLTNLAESLRAILTDAGWRPGLPRKIPLFALFGRGGKFVQEYLLEFCGTDRIPVSRRFADFGSHTAFGLLDELFGIVIRRPAMPSLSPTNLKFYPFYGRSSPKDIKDLSRLVGSRLIPIGDLDSVATLLCDEDGAIYALGHVESGVLEFGKDLNSAMATLLTGKPAPFMKFTEDQDPDYKFSI